MSPLDINRLYSCQLHSRHLEELCFVEGSTQTAGNKLVQNVGEFVPYPVLFGRWRSAKDTEICPSIDLRLGSVDNKSTATLPPKE